MIMSHVSAMNGQNKWHSVYTQTSPFALFFGFVFFPSLAHFVTRSKQRVLLRVAQNVRNRDKIFFILNILNGFISNFYKQNLCAPFVQFNRFVFWFLVRQSEANFHQFICDFLCRVVGIKVCKLSFVLQQPRARGINREQAEKAAYGLSHLIE